MFKLNEILTLKYGKNQKSVESPTGYPIYGTGGIIGYANKCLYNKESILFGRKGSISRVQFVDKPFWCVDTTFYSIINKNIVIPKYLFYKLSTIDFNSYNEGTTIPSLRSETLNEIVIDIHNYKEQQHIVNTIGSVDDLIEKYNEILNKIEKFEHCLYLYEKTSISSNALKDYVMFEKGKKPNELSENGNIYLTIDVLEGNESLYTNSENIVKCNENDILMVMDGASSGKVYIGFNGVVGSTLSLIHCNNINPYYLYVFLKNNFNNIKDRNIGSAIPHTNKDFILSLNIPTMKIKSDVYNNILNLRIDVNKKITKLKKLKQHYLNKYFK